MNFTAIRGSYKHLILLKKNSKQLLVKTVIGQGKSALKV